MSTDARGALATLIDAIAAVTGQSARAIMEEFEAAHAAGPEQQSAGREDLQHLTDQLSTRLGLSSAVTAEQAAGHRVAMAALKTDPSGALTPQELQALSTVLRHATEVIPTLDRDPVLFEALPAHQVEMWHTLLALELTGQPWLLVGGQMTMLHCVENGVRPSRTTDDGDIVLNVWTRRNSLRTTSRFLRDRGFAEDRTSDGYGYRFRRDGQTVIDVLLPEGLERQHSYPTTASGRPGVSTEGANQAFKRAERVPVVIGEVAGHLRRPDLLGALVLKASAYLTDSRDVGRHAQDIVVLSEIALQNPRATLSRVTTHDRKRLRPFVRRLTADHPYLRQARDREAVLLFLRRFVEEPVPSRSAGDV